MLRQMFLYLVKRKDLVIVGIVISAFSFIYSYIGIQKHQHFQTFGWDTAVFDQQVYLVSQGKVPFSSLHGFIGLGDHFHPLLYLIGGNAYKVWSNAGMLYIIQSVLASLSAVPLYLSSLIILRKTKLVLTSAKILSGIIVFLYLFSVSFQFMVVGEYNDAPTVALPLLCLLYFVLKGNLVGYWVSFIFMLLTKEEYSLLSVPIAIYLCIKHKDFSRSLITLIIGLTYFFILTFLIMPRISGTKEYIFFSSANRPQSIVSEMLRNPSLFVTKFLDNQEKRNTILISLTSFGFLPVLAPIELILPTATLAIRFYDDSIPRRFEFNNQYAAGLIPPLVFASIFGLKKLITFLIRRKIPPNQIIIFLTAFLISVGIYQDLLFHGPINSIFKKQFYQTEEWEINAKELVKQVPEKVIVASQNSLLPHISQREEFFLLPKVGGAEYIVVDLADGPNKFAPIDKGRTQILILKLLESGEYMIVWEKGESMLLRRI